MREIGKVIKTDKTTAQVSVDKKGECEKCGMCLFKDGAKSITFSVLNDINAKTDDTVMIEGNDNGKLLGVLLVFFVPLLLIGLSVILAYLIIKNELFTIIFSIVFIAIWYIILSAIDNKLKRNKNFNFKIVEIISVEGEENERNNRNNE